MMAGPKGVAFEEPGTGGPMSGLRGAKAGVPVKRAVMVSRAWEILSHSLSAEL